MLRAKPVGLTVLACVTVAMVVGWASLPGGSDAAVAQRAVRHEYDLGRPRTREAHHYVMVTKAVNHEDDGTRRPAMTLTLYLRCDPVAPGSGEPDVYTCLRNTVQDGQAAEVTIPALDGFSHPLIVGAQQPVFGVPLAPFEALEDSSGSPLGSGLSYVVYNQFIDFHAFCNAFAVPISGGSGIQDLKHVGDRIVHAAAFSRGAIGLGSSAAEGSYFQNGEITLTFKGIGRVGDVPCAVVAYDSGESSFQMTSESTPNVQVLTRGSSHYWGDIYINLDTMWVQKADMTEIVVMKTTMADQKVAGGAAERTVTIEALSREEFEGL